MTAAPQPARQPARARPVSRDERLVARDYVCAALDGTQNQRAGGLDATHELDHDIGAEHQLLSVGRKQLAR